MRIEGVGRTWQVDDVQGVDDAFTWRDRCGGALLWSTHDRPYPALAVRISGDLADVHFFPYEGHPGFRCIGGDWNTAAGSTKLVYDGCDPASGEDTPDMFIVSVQTARSIACEFLRSSRMSSEVSWFEL